VKNPYMKDFFTREIYVCALLDINSLCAKCSAEMRIKMRLDEASIRWAIEHIKNKRIQICFLN
jgi:hypothetical protein